MLEQDQNKIEEVLKAVEDKRLAFVYEIDKKNANEKLSNRMTIVLSILIAIGLCYVFSGDATSFVVVELLVLGFLLKSDVSNNRQQNLYHRIAMETLLNSFYPDISYKGLWNAFKKDVEKSLLLRGEMSGTNHLSGRTKNRYYFECVEVRQGANISSRQFNGIFFKLECPLFFSNPIVIIQKSIGASMGYFMGYKELTIKGVDSYFASKYSVFVKDAIEAEDLLTPEFLQPFINLSKQHLDIYWSFVDNQIYFATSAKIRMFDSLEMNNSILTPSILDKFHADVKFCQNISEELGQQIDIISERTKIGDLGKNSKIKDLEDPYQHLVDE